MDPFSERQKPGWANQDQILSLLSSILDKWKSHVSFQKQQGTFLPPEIPSLDSSNPKPFIDFLMGDDWRHTFNFQLLSFFKSFEEEGKMFAGQIQKRTTKVIKQVWQTLKKEEGIQLLG